MFILRSLSIQKEHRRLVWIPREKAFFSHLSQGQDRYLENLRHLDRHLDREMKPDA